MDAWSHKFLYKVNFETSGIFDYTVNAIAA